MSPIGRFIPLNPWDGAELTFPGLERFVESEVLPTWRNFSLFIDLEDAADYTAFGAHRGAVDGDGLRTGHEGDDRGDFLGSFKAL